MHQDFYIDLTHETSGGGLHLKWKRHSVQKILKTKKQYKMLKRVGTIWHREHSMLKFGCYTFFDKKVTHPKQTFIQLNQGPIYL